jgi:hypothetical protein
MTTVLPSAGIFSAVLAGLAPSATPGSMSTGPTLFTFGGHEIVAGRDHSGRPHLLIPLSALALDEPLDQIAKGLFVKRESFVIGSGDPSYYLDVECLVDDSDDVFGAICNDFCQRIDGGTGDETLVTTLTSTVEKWREILKNLSEREPAENEINGVIGELLLLEAVAHKFGATSIEYWFGPDNTRHDFELPSQSVEVKTSKSLASKKIRVHGLKQFDVKPGDSLSLVLFQIERMPSGDSILTICERLEAVGVSRSRLEASLAKFGPNLISDAPKWVKSLQIRVVQTSIFKVTDSFPSLKATQLGADQLARLSSFDYELRLDGMPSEELAGFNKEVISDRLFS